MKKNNKTLEDKSEGIIITEDGKTITAEDGKTLIIDTPLKEVQSEDNTRKNKPSNIGTIKANALTLKNLSNGWGGDKQAYNYGNNDFGLQALNTSKGFSMLLVGTTIADLDELEVIKATSIATANLKQNIFKTYIALLLLIDKYPSQFTSDCTLNFETKQLAEILGRKDTEDFRRDLLKYLKVINFTTISVKKGQANIQIGGGYFGVSRRKGTAYFQFQNKFFVVMVKTGFVTNIPYQILQTDANKNPTAFRIGFDFILQKRLNIGAEGTAKKKRQNSVSVKTLYEDLISTKEIEPYNPKTGHFKDRYRPNFEKGINYYKGTLFKKWHYKDKNGIGTFEEWIKNTIIVEYTDEIEKALTQQVLTGQETYNNKIQKKQEKALAEATKDLLSNGDEETKTSLKKLVKETTNKEMKPHLKAIRKAKKQLENQVEIFDDFLHGTDE